MKKYFNLLRHYGSMISHKAQVMRFLLKTCWELIKRGIVHDFSKFGSKEAPLFAETVAELRGLTYGTDEYFECLERMKPAIEHHYKKNSHHPEHYDGTLREMSLLDMIEMLADWKAATLRHDDGDVLRSIEQNSDRFQYDDEMKAKMLEFYEEIGAV